MKQCPYCAEEIQDAAVVCRFCGRDLANPSQPPTRSAVATPVNINTTSQSVKKNSSCLLRGAILAGLFAVFTCICFTVVAIFSPNKDTKKTNESPTLQAQGEISSTEAGKNTPDAKNTEIPNTTKAPVPTKTPAPTKTPVPTKTQELGKTRDNPIPANTAVKIGGDMVVTILSVVRPADDVVRKGNMFNTEPEDGQEYLQVEMQVVCDKPKDQKCSFSTYEFKVVGSDGIVKEAEIFLSGVEGMIESGEFFGGASKTGTVYFIVTKGDNEVVIYYEPLLFGNPIYLGLP